MSLRCLALLLLLAPRAGLAAPCDLLGGDSDGDGICNDGSASGVVGDLPCSCAPGSPPVCVTGCDDNCPWVANPAQFDAGRVGDPDVPDGIGDDCQCLDVADDGRGDVGDSSRLRRLLASLLPPLPAPDKCPGAGPASCDAADVSSLRNVLAALAPAPANVCLAAGACTASGDCPPGTGCNTSAQRCGHYAGRACVQASQCLGGGCCAQACRDLQSDAANCGGCGTTCQNPHGTTACTAGACVPSCSFGWGSCDSNAQNGCERSLTTLTDCGSCGVVCNLANASESCATGSCQLTGCQTNYSNCDGNGANGCEVSHTTYPTTCAAGPYLGAYDGDVACGFICGSNSGWDVFANASGRTSAWYRARLVEGSNCPATIQHRIELSVPAGADYDLYVWRPCGTLAASSTNAGSTPEQVILSQPDNTSVQDDFDYWVEVRFYSGASCSSWALTLSGHNC